MRHQSTHSPSASLPQTAEREALSALAAASLYRSLGWSVIPTAGKTPHLEALRSASEVEGWAQYRAEPADEQTIESWYRAAPDAGVAVITGVASGLVVCDIEPDGLASVPPQILKAQTPTAATPSGGLHVYFAAGEPVLTRRRNLVGWGDLQGEGAYVVAPGGSPARTWVIAPDATALAPWGDYQHLLEPKTDGKGPSSPEAIPSLEDIPDPLDDLLRWDTDPRFVAAFCALVGITVPVGARFTCFLPGHGPDRTPSANLWPDPKTGRVLYRCWQRGETFGLAQVYAALCSGRPAGEFVGPVLALWKLRLLLDAGLVSSPDVELPPLPDDAPNYAAEAYPGLVRLFQTRALSKMGHATPLAPAFLGAWMGISEHRAKEARHYFRTHGTVHKTGDSAGRAHLYLPGPAQSPLEGRPA